MKTYLTDAERHVSPARLAVEYPYCVRFQLPVTKDRIYVRWFQTEEQGERYLADLPADAVILPSGYC